MSQSSELIRFFDSNEREHFIHPATIADAAVSIAGGGITQVAIATTGGGVGPSIIVRGKQAEALLRELRRRAGVPDEAEAAEPAPATPLA